MTREKVNRINELAKIAKTRTLSGEEMAERDQLRAEYIASVTGNLKSQLDQTYFLSPSGEKEKLQKKKPKES